jgi:hypothetical protein
MALLTCYKFKMAENCVHLSHKTWNTTPLLCKQIYHKDVSEIPYWSEYKASPHLQEMSLDKKEH